MKIFILALTLLATQQFAHAQGCSDAGVCTVPGLQAGSQHEAEADVQNQLTFGISAGRADHSINVVNAYAEYSRTLFRGFSMNTRLTTGAYSGSLASTAGLSDVYLNAVYSGFENAIVTAGVKFPLSDGNRKENSTPLPMDYQTSLGTIDLILGSSFEIATVRFALALQQPLTQNSNAFFADSAFSAFQSTNNYVRKGDVMLRISYPLFSNETWTMTAGLLPIYHLDNDEFTDRDGVQKTIAGSSGLTLNGNITAEYVVNSSQSAKLNVGAPFITREVRPDGLTRAFVAALEYSVKF